MKNCSCILAQMLMGFVMFLLKKLLRWIFGVSAPKSVLLSLTCQFWLPNSNKDFALHVLLCPLGFFGCLDLNSLQQHPHHLSPISRPTTSAKALSSTKGQTRTQNTKDLETQRSCWYPKHLKLPVLSDETPIICNPRGHDSSQNHRGNAGTQNPRDPAGCQNPSGDTLLHLRAFPVTRTTGHSGQKTREEPETKGKTSNKDKFRNWHLNL